MFNQLAIDRITETENLTDNLDDDTAEWLINWGIESARKLIGSSTDKEVADVTINRIMAIMRKLNKIGANYQNVQLEELSSFTEAYNKAFGTTNHSNEQYQAVANEIKPMSSLDMIKSLISFADGKQQLSGNDQPRGCRSLFSSLLSSNKD
jgi:hypothetical protein